MQNPNLANLTTQYQQAYLIYCYKIMQYLQALAWLAEQKAPQNQANTAKVKPKSASGVKKLAQEVNQEKPTFKSLKHQEKAGVSTIVALGFPNGAMSAAFRVAFNEVAGGNSQKAARSKLSEYELDKFDYYYITSVDDIAGNVDGAISNTGFIEYVFGQSGRNIDQSNRYIYLQKYSVMVDLQHVVSASNNPFTSKAAGAAAGYWIEMIQSAKGQESAMQPEDLFSNKLGSYIGFRVSNNIEPSGTTIGLKVQQFIQNSSPVLNNNKALSIYSNQVKNQ